MKILKIKFVDFWYGFAPAENYFYNLLSSFYNVELSDDPELLIYSSYGRAYLNYKCIRIFYSAENLRPDFTGCDYAISFDYNKDPRHYRLPLYALYMNDAGIAEKLTTNLSREEALRIWRSKTKFCCMVVSNAGSAKRLTFFKKLSLYKKVDSGGKVLNNTGGPVANKMEFIKDYRFVIAFENTSHAGYTTEKIIEPLIADCIPLYWGDPKVTNEFNAHSFLWLSNNKTEEQLIEEIKRIDNDEEMAVKFLMADKFVNNTIPLSICKETLLAFFHKIEVEKDLINPVAKSGKRFIHAIKIKRKRSLYNIQILANAMRKSAVKLISSSSKF